MALPRPCLMLVTDRSLCGGTDGLVAAVEAAVEGGADAVQLREKDLPLSDLLPLTLRLRQATLGRALLLVNGPPDVALTASADGVHLPEDASPVQRPQQGSLIGRSVHSLDAARCAEAEGADYLIAGPVYRTRSHPGREPVGLSLIRDVTASVRAPVLAIGGITAGRVEEVVRAGASGIAVISAILAQRDGRPAAGELRRVLDGAWMHSSALRRPS